MKMAKKALATWRIGQTPAESKKTALDSSITSNGKP